MQDEKFKTMQDVAKGQGRRITITGEMQEEIQERMKPVEETYRLKLQNESDKIDKTINVKKNGKNSSARPSPESHPRLP